jgi:tRNA A-37 threonylcarbamoyl transferase component Bud32
MTQTAPDLRLVSAAPETPPDPLIGQVLDGRYEVEKVLGAGGMGLVYKAKHVVLGKALAVKVLKQEVTRDEGVMARFRREAQSASAVGSPHICEVSDFGSLPDGSAYFIMEYLDGPSLTKAMEDERPMAAPRIAIIAKQLCDALGAAHERGIVHRDLKPDNVHLVRQGKRTDFVKVLDFGIAKVGGAADKKLTQAGQVFGTPHYMSPEQCSGRDVDHRTDIYAVGVMLYEMACGTVPFDADNLMGILTKHVYEQPIPPRELPPPVNVPAGLEAIILKCLAKKPDQRYQSMYELRSDLDIWSEGGTPLAVMETLDPTGLSVTASMIGRPSPNISVPAMTMSPATPAVVHEAPPKRTGLIVLAVIGLLLMGAAAFAGAFLFFGPQNGEQVAQRDPEPIASPEPEVVPEAEPPPPVVVQQPEQPPPPPAPTIVRLTTEPEGAEVLGADGTMIGNAPLDIERPEGSETLNLTIRAPGYQERTFTVARLTSANVTVRLERAPSGRGPRPRPPGPVVGGHQPTVTPLVGGGQSPPPRPRDPGGGVGSEIINPF